MHPYPQFINKLLALALLQLSGWSQTEDKSKAAKPKKTK